MAFYARKAGIPFSLFEASEKVGGNCTTLSWGEFRYDTGAHRFHDKDHGVTRDLRELLGDNLRSIHTPSQIFHRGKFLNFPLTPLNLLRHLGVYTVSKAGLEVARARMKNRAPADSFHHYATRTYGATIAARFLLNYSEKLWGLPSARLSPNISGNRLKGLCLRTLLLETVSRRKSKTLHLDGSFYYPRGGIGLIAETMADYGGRENVRCNSPVTRVIHRQGRITAIETASHGLVPAAEVVSTLPPGQFLECLDPPAPDDIRRLAAQLHFRYLVLVALFLDSPSVTANASVYFPDPDTPFTRVFEPRNRSASMSPPGRTSLVAEIPCPEAAGAWSWEDGELIALVQDSLTRIGWLRERRVLGAAVHRIRNAYPILEVGVEQSVLRLGAYLQGFSNLRVSGRNGRFQYAHIHDMMRFAKEIVQGDPPGPQVQRVVGPS